MQNIRPQLSLSLLRIYPNILNCCRHAFTFPSCFLCCILVEETIVITGNSTYHCVKPFPGLMGDPLWSDVKIGDGVLVGCPHKVL